MLYAERPGSEVVPEEHVVGSDRVDHVRALRRTLGRDEIVVEVNPEDAETVRAWLTMGRQDGDRPIDIRAERRVDRGGCIVRTVEGEIDAQLPVQLARADELLRQTFAEQRA